MCHFYRIMVFFAFVLLTFSSLVGQSGNIISKVRSEYEPEIWEAFSDSYKFELCIRYKINEMRNLAGKISGPINLIENYPSWQESLKDLLDELDTDRSKAEKLLEAVSSEMAKVIGEETARFLHLQRIYSDKSKEDWIDNWRTYAIIGIAGVEEILSKK